MNAKANRQRFGLCFVGCLAALLTSSAQAQPVPTTWYVDADAPTSGQTGENWDHPFVTIQQAVNEASAGDEIRVAGGTYKPASQTSPIELKGGVNIKGGYEGYGSQTPDARTEESILSGDLNGNDDPGTPSTYSDNARGVVFIPDGTQPPAQSGDFADRANLDGFTITASRHTAALHTTLYEVTTATSAIIRKCKIHNNTATVTTASPDGAGVHVGENATIVFRQCEIYDNDAQYDGGGIAVGGQITVLDCSIHDNTAGFDGGAIKVIQNTAGIVLVVSSTIANNESAAYGGGIAIVTSGGTLKVINSKLIGNTAVSGGGAIRLFGGQVFEMTNCTLSGNSATGQHGVPGHCGGICGGQHANNFIKNSIIWNNSATNFPEIDTGHTVTYSNVKQTSGTYPGTGNINSDPLFAGDYSLQCGSLCINTASDAAVPCDSLDVDENGAMCGTSPQNTPDLDLLARIIGSAVDMGAYERQSAGCPAADATADGEVDVQDLLAVINQWGGSCPCTADVTPAPCGNGSVDVQDLLLVINSWGMTCLGGGGGSMPESISDCLNDVCAGLSGEDWQRCMDACIDAVCENNPEECE